MERKRITCPETTHLELIDIDRTPFGALIAGCSRFLPRCAMGCSRECAVHLDHRGRRPRHTEVKHAPR
jgi:hypothetical protein